MPKITPETIEELNSFIDNAAYHVTGEGGGTIIMERITRVYTSLKDPETPKDQLHSLYKLLAGYALLGLQRVKAENDAEEG